MNWDLAGHEWAVALLQQHLINQQVRHAYLFTGPPSIGRRTLAIRFTQAICCPQPLQPGEPCQVCRTCLQIERQEYPDLDIVQAEGGSRNIKVDQIRNLQHKVSLAPYASKFRIALLVNFQDANPNAQNALLKTLEEAPEKVILLLTADTPEALLPTIVSRCEIMRLRPLSLEAATRSLSSLDKMDPGQAKTLAHLSGGRIGYARFLHENPGELEKREAMVEQLFALLPASRRERFSYAEQLTRDWGKSRENLSQVIQVWLSIWRDVLLCSSSAEVPLTNLVHEPQLRKLGAQIDVDLARSVLAVIESGLEKIEMNANPRLLAEVLFLEMPRIIVEGLP
jgi:DNA polymerase III subunit delta'